MLGPDTSVTVYATTANARVRAGEILAQLTGSEGAPSQERYVAVDLEWPVVRKVAKKQAKVAVVQIATPRRQGLYLPYARMAPAGSVSSGPEDSSRGSGRAEVGVNISCDVAKLKTDWGVIMRPVVDLGALAKERGPRQPSPDKSTRSRRTVLPVPFWTRTRHARLSDWSAPMSADQKAYAALDVFATLRVYQSVMSTETVYDSIRPTNLDQLQPGQGNLVVCPIGGGPCQWHASLWWMPPVWASGVRCHKVKALVLPRELDASSRPAAW